MLFRVARTALFHPPFATSRRGYRDVISSRTGPYVVRLGMTTQHHLLVRRLVGVGLVPRSGVRLVVCLPVRLPVRLIVRRSSAGLSRPSNYGATVTTRCRGRLRTRIRASDSVAARGRCRRGLYLNGSAALCLVGRHTPR